MSVFKTVVYNVSNLVMLLNIL